MKTQMRFQKILMLLTLIIAAIGVVFALFFCSGAFAQLTQLEGFDTDIDNCVEVVQSVNDSLLILGVVFVVVCVLPFVTGCQSRRKYYITNYVAIGVVIAMQIVFAVLVIVFLMQASQAFSAIDLDMAKSNFELYEFNKSFGEFQKSAWTLTFGYVLVALVLVNAVVLGLNVLWKVKLMKGEKALLTASDKETVAKEVA